jgi:hypothetical protein
MDSKIPDRVETLKDLIAFVNVFIEMEAEELDDLTFILDIYDKPILDGMFLESDFDAFLSFADNASELLLDNQCNLKNGSIAELKRHNIRIEILSSDISNSHALVFKNKHNDQEYSLLFSY